MVDLPNFVVEHYFTEIVQFIISASMRSSLLQFYCNKTIPTFSQSIKADVKIILL